MSKTFSLVYLSMRENQLLVTDLSFRVEIMTQNRICYLSFRIFLNITTSFKWVVPMIIIGTTRLSRLILSYESSLICCIMSDILKRIRKYIWRGDSCKRLIYTSTIKQWCHYSHISYKGLQACWEPHHNKLIYTVFRRFNENRARQKQIKNKSLKLIYFTAAVLRNHIISR